MLRLRREGLTNKQVAARLGYPVRTVAAEMQRMRALGWTMPAAGQPFTGRDLSVTVEAETLRAALTERGYFPEAGRQAA